MASFEGDVRLIFKHFPLPGHRNAVPAARTAWAAQQQGKFWEFHDWLFESRALIEKLPELVKEHGLDGDKLGADMQSEASSDAVDDDRIAGGVVVEGLGYTTQRLGMVEDAHRGTSSQAASKFRRPQAAAGRAEWPGLGTEAGWKPKLSPVVPNWKQSLLHEQAIRT